MKTPTRSTLETSNSTLSSTFSLDRTSLSGHCTTFTLDVEYQSKTQQTVECPKESNDIQIQCALLMDGNTTAVEGDELISRLTKQKIDPSRVVKALKWYLMKYGGGVFINRGMQAGLHLDVTNLPTPNETVDNVSLSRPETFIAKSSLSLGSINKNKASKLPRRRSTSLAIVTNVFSAGPTNGDHIKSSKQGFKSCIPLAIKTAPKTSKALVVKSTPISRLPVRRGFETRIPIYRNTLEEVCKKVDFSSQINRKPKYLMTQSTTTNQNVQQFSQTDLPNLQNNFIEKIHGVFNKGSTVWIALKQSPLSSFSIKNNCSFSHVEGKSREVGHLEFASSMETVVCRCKPNSRKVKSESQTEMNPWNLAPSLMDRVRCCTSLSNVPTEDRKRILDRCQDQSRSRLVYYALDQNNTKKSLRLPHSVGRSSKERNSRSRRMAQSDPSLFRIVREERTTGGRKTLVRKTSKRTTLALAHKAVSETDFDLSSYVQEQPPARKKVQVLYQCDASTLTLKRKGSRGQMQKWEKSIVQTEKTLHNLRQKITHLNELLKRGGKEEMLGIHYFNSAKRCVRKSTCPNVTRSMMFQTTGHAGSHNYKRHAAEERVGCHNRQRCQCMKDPTESFPHVPSVPLHLLVPHSVI